jgi:hypothetical protein
VVVGGFQRGAMGSRLGIGPTTEGTGPEGIRTPDLAVKSRLLYRLSYGPTDGSARLGSER